MRSVLLALALLVPGYADCPQEPESPSRLPCLTCKEPVRVKQIALLFEKKGDYLLKFTFRRPGCEKLACRRALYRGLYDKMGHYVYRHYELSGWADCCDEEGGCWGIDATIDWVSKKIEEPRI